MGAIESSLTGSKLMQTDMNFRTLAGSLALAAALLAGSGCKELPGSPQAQGATIGGVGGAVAGAAIGGSEHRLLGAIIGGALGAGGGYVIGANSDKIRGKDREGAETAVQNAQSSPATASQARAASTGDINSDGFVTMDEMVALKSAGFSDQEILDRLKATGQVFELTAEQRDHLVSSGLSRTLVNRIEDLNQDKRNELSTTHSDVIGSSKP
jgi:hypothetical protein